MGIFKQMTRQVLNPLSSEEYLPNPPFEPTPEAATFMQQTDVPGPFAHDEIEPLHRFEVWPAAATETVNATRHAGYIDNGVLIFVCAASRQSRPERPHPQRGEPTPRVQSYADLFLCPYSADRDLEQLPGGMMNGVAGAP